MQLSRTASIAGIALITMTVAIVVAFRGWHWYQGLLRPRSVAPQVGATVWSSPAGAVGVSLHGPAESPTPRNDAARLLRNPEPPTPASVERGKAAYDTHCAACHGGQGHGDGPAAAKLLVPPPDLTASVGRRADGYLYATIRNGGALMPPLGSRISAALRWDLVNYLRSIAAAPEQNIPEALTTRAPEGSSEAAQAGTQEPHGDVARGRQVFEANCQLCHSADTEEIIVGPGLKGLFQRPPHKLSDGTEHAEHNVGVIRKQILEGGGTMAPVGASLSDQEIADLIAYLQTL